MLVQLVPEHRRHLDMLAGIPDQQFQHDYSQGLD